MQRRYHKLDHISFIQANLKEMKDSVSQYLKKSHNETVPSVLRPRHYLILSCLQELNTKGNGLGEEMQVIRELSSERLGNTIDGDKFQPLRQGYEREKNKIVKTKRQVNSLHRSTGDVDCLLPNICQLRLELEQGGNRMAQRKNPLEGKTIQCSQEIQRSESLGRDQRYHSIDLNHQFKWTQNAEGQNSGLRVTNKWLSASKSRELIKTLRQKHTWIDEKGEQQARSPTYDQDVTLDLTKERIPDPETSKDKGGKLVYHQRRESIMKRRIEANRKLAKDAQHHHSKPIPLRQQLQSSNKKVFKFQKGENLPEGPLKRIEKLKQIQSNNECSPWRDVNAKKESSFLQTQIF